MNATEGDWLLEILSPDGGVDRTVELCEPEFDVGRNACGLQFSDDPEMADRHACLRVNREGVEVSDTEEGSGIWIRVRRDEGRHLAANDQIWVGSQVLVVAWENELWKLRHHGPEGQTFELHTIESPGVFIGRGSELVLDPTDRALSRRHAQIVVEGETLVLYDRGAHNGTYFKLNQPETMSFGDEFRLARQHFRILGYGSGGTPPDSSAEALVSDDSEGQRRPAGQGLAARLRALGASPARQVGGAEAPVADRAHMPIGADQVGTEPSRASPAHPDSEAETVLVVIDSEEGSVTLEVARGKTVLEAVQEAGLERGAPIDWECVDGRCGVCVVGVVEGADRLEPPDRATGEMRTIQITEQVTPDPGQYRLACLARVRGRVRLRRLT